MIIFSGKALRVWRPQGHITTLSPIQGLILRTIPKCPSRHETVIPSIFCDACGTLEPHDNIACTLANIR